ncbi:DUF4435 domain-containing protein [Psychrobacter sp. T6-6]|uniref:DUF4435 domain-containing protein n=1 Tax=Psychrobacter sp. T6-6 TaxID=3457452 RepID=UPI003FCF1F49
MSMVEAMLSELEDTSVLLSKFMDISKSKAYKKKELIPCIVEGDEDYSFYEPKVRPLLEMSLEKIISGGIDKAIEFLNVINESNYYSGSIFIIFLDSDFGLNLQNKLEDSRVFYLNKYSIENFYITDDFFCNILESLTKLEKERDSETGEISEDSDFIKVRNFILSERDNLLLLLEDYMICLRAIVTGESEIEFKSFKDILPKLVQDKNLINDNNELIIPNFKNIFDLEYLSQAEIGYVENNILDSKEYFSRVTSLDSYRGKELVFIAHRVLSLAKSTFHKKSDRINTKLKFKKQIKEEDFICDFTAYTEEPKGLRDFIENIKASYI